MSDKGEIAYLKSSITELLEECEDVELLYLIKVILLEDAN